MTPEVEGTRRPPQARSAIIVAVREAATHHKAAVTFGGKAETIGGPSWRGLAERARRHRDEAIRRALSLGVTAEALEPFVPLDVIESAKTFIPRGAP